MCNFAHGRDDLRLSTLDPLLASVSLSSSSGSSFASVSSELEVLDFAQIEAELMRIMTANDA